jgi:hypothetical protein
MTKVYMGCISNRVGHFYMVNGKKSFFDHPELKTMPWDHLDSKDLISSEPGMSQGTAWLHHKEGWSALGIVDNSVDKRPGSRAVFAIDKPNMEAIEIVYAMANLYERIVIRIGPVTVERINGAKLVIPFTITGEDLVKYHHKVQRIGF